MLLKLSLSSEYPFWLALVCLIVGVGLSYFLYRRSKENKEVSKRIRILLFAIRSMYLSLIAFLLISPFIRSEQPIYEKPIFIIGRDMSQSIANLNDSNELQQFATELGDFRNALSEKFEVAEFGFGESVEPIEESDWYNGRTTDFSAFFREIYGRFENRNVAGMLIASDGLYNRGENPIYTQNYVPFEVHSVVLGDTGTYRDAWLDRMEYNRIAFLGNTFDLSVHVGASLLKGKQSSVVVKRNGRVIESKKISITSDDFNERVEFKLKAEELGILRFDVEVSEVEGEESASNNVKSIYVEVLEGKRNVLVLTAAPHPDIAALTNAVNESKHYTARAVNLKDYAGDVSAYDLIVLYQLPAGNAGRIPNDLLKSNASLLFIFGKNSDIDQYNGLDYPLKLNRFRRRYNEVVGLVNRDFSYFGIDFEKATRISEYPPLISPFASYESNSPVVSLFRQKIGKVETDMPLISFTEENGRKTGYICGEGFWRWRLYDYRLNGNSRLFDDLFRQIVQYLSVREDRSRFRVNLEPSYFEDERVVVYAEYYDKSFELNNDFEATFYLTDEEGKEFDFSFLKTSSAYQLDLGRLEKGSYQWRAELSDGMNRYSKKGELSIKELQLEMNRLKADQTLLYNLSNNFGGEMYFPGDLAVLAEKLNADNRFKTILHYREKLMEFIAFKWIFVFLLLLMSAEWFVRKYLGLN